MPPRFGLTLAFSNSNCRCVSAPFGFLNIGLWLGLRLRPPSNLLGLGFTLAALGPTVSLRIGELGETVLLQKRLDLGVLHIKIDFFRLLLCHFITRAIVDPRPHTPQRHHVRII